MKRLTRPSSTFKIIKNKILGIGIKLYFYIVCFIFTIIHFVYIDHIGIDYNFYLFIPWIFCLYFYFKCYLLKKQSNKQLIKRKKKINEI